MAVGSSAAAPKTAPEVHVDVRLKQRGLDAIFKLKPGVTTAIIGPNGAGKTTLLDLIAGVIRPSDGVITVGEADFTSPAHVVPPHQRDMSFLTQDGLLFPHLSVVENVAFGLRSRGIAKRPALECAADQLKALGVAALADRQPEELSGGQAQRVALARALGTNPQVLLLDEPFAALDAHSAPVVRNAVREHGRGRTIALVTHDLLDVLTLAEHLVILDGGQVVESGPTARVLAEPRSEFLAGFLGVNVLRGHLSDERLTVDADVTISGIPRVGNGEAHAAQVRGQPRPGWATFSPQAPTIHRQERAVNGSSARNYLPAIIHAIEPRGPVVRVRSWVGTQLVAVDVTAASVADMGLESGQKIFLSIKAAAVSLY